MIEFTYFDNVIISVLFQRELQSTKQATWIIYFPQGKQFGKSKMYNGIIKRD